MTGRICSLNDVVTKTTKALLVLPPTCTPIRKRRNNPKLNIRNAMSVCSQCSMCTSLCPRNLLGQSIKPNEFMRALANGLTKEVGLAESVAAPVYAGDTLGQLTVRDAAGNTVAELPILAGEDVGHVTFVQMLGRCLERGFCMGPQS